MLVAHHCVLSAYGFWLPNDPRGSWSTAIFSDALFRAAGSATKTTSRRSLAAIPHDASRRRAGKAALKYPPVCFNGIQARAIARGFSTAIAQGGYRLFACAILPEHVHVVVAHDARKIEAVVGHLKRRATLRLLAENIHPFQGRSPLPSVWAEKEWDVEVPADQLQAAIRYVEENPVKAGLPRQKWWFVKPP